MSTNRKINFVECEEKLQKEEEQKREKILQEEKIKKLEEQKKKEEEQKRKRNEIKSLFEELNKKYTSVKDCANLSKKSDYIAKAIKLLLMNGNQGQGILLGAFGFYSDELVEKIINEINYNQFYVNIDKNTKLSYLGCINYKQCKDDIFLHITSIISNYYSCCKKNFYDDYEISPAFNALSRRFFFGNEIDNFNEHKEFKLNSTRNNTEMFGERRFYLQRYYYFQDDEKFYKDLKDFLRYEKYNTRFVIWVKAYKYNFELFERLYKISLKTGIIFIITTLCNSNIVKEKLENEILCEPNVIFGKLFNYNGINTYVEV